MTYDDHMSHAIAMSEARARHGAKPPRCQRFECERPAVGPRFVACEECERETDAILARFEDDRDRRMGA